MSKAEKGLTRLGDLLPKVMRPELKPLTSIQERLVMMPHEEDPDVLYQHSVLCQTCMPYRDPGDVKIWQRRNGLVSLHIQAGSAYDASHDNWVAVGLPHGAKPRLVLCHLNTEATKTQSPLIYLEHSLTAFVKRTLGLDTKGRNIKTVKDQLSRLAAADFRFGMGIDGRSVTIKSNVIEGFELWTPKHENQRVLWPTTVQFSRPYFESLMAHAVPLNEQAIARLSHSAMALDIYTWLAQRLHRVSPGKATIIPWMNLKDQFGQDYGRMVDFRRVFLRTLKQVKAVYPAAKIEADDRSLKLWHSVPPVLKRLR